jgi:hypothetical protein
LKAPDQVTRITSYTSYVKRTIRLFFMPPAPRHSA